MAHGVGFVVLEDETGRLPLAMAPRLAVDLRGILRDARYLVAVGRLEHVRWYRSLRAFQLTRACYGLALESGFHGASWQHSGNAPRP